MEKQAGTIPTETEVAIIGAGPGGYVAAIKAAQLGKQVTVIDRDSVGGTCLNYGCIPSKALIGIGNLVEKIHHASAMGVEVEGVRVDFAKVQAYKQKVVDRLTGGVAMLLKKNKVTVVGGEARFVSPGELSVTVDGAEHRMKAKAIIVATGGKPIEIPGFKIDGENIISSKEALELTEGPKRLAVIGGGFIGLEIGTFYLKTGSELTVIELLPQLLPGADPDLVKVVQRGLKKRKAKIHLESQAKGWTRTDDGVVLDCISGEKEFKVTVDKVLLSVGVRPSSQGLGLEDIGVEMDRRGHIIVDKKLQTNVPGVYAIGDVTPGYYLAHRASKEGIVAAEIIAGKDVELDYRCLPAAVFTDPEIGSVGMTEPQAREAGHDIKVGRFPFAASGRALAAGETEGFTKVITDAKDGLILGVQIVGMEASNLIAEAALAIEAGITAEDLALTIHAHPTLPEALMEAAEASIGKAIHVLQ